MLEYLEIEGYNSEFVSRRGRRGDGVGVYMKGCFKYKIRKDTDNHEPDIKPIWIKLT